MRLRNGTNRFCYRSTFFCNFSSRLYILHHCSTLMHVRDNVITQRTEGSPSLFSSLSRALSPPVSAFELVGFAQNSCPRLCFLLSVWSVDHVDVMLSFLGSIRGGGGTPPYKVYRYVPPQRVWFFSRFGLKTGIDFDNYGLKSGRVFGAGNIYESLQTYFSSQYVTGTTN